jgi:hypothetical protein
MAMLISQIIDGDTLLVAVRFGGRARILNARRSVYSLALEAARSGVKLAELVEQIGLGRAVDLEAASRDGRLSLPISHPDPAHLHLTGTALPPVSAKRDTAGPPPDWIYKGNGSIAVAPGAPLIASQMTGGVAEAPALASIYVVGDDGLPFRVGFSVANMVAERAGATEWTGLNLHPRPRSISFGPEILVGDLPSEVAGTARAQLASATLYERTFTAGEARLPAALDDLERHHFSYELFRRPGDVHIHLIELATSPARGEFDVDGFELEVPGFGLPLFNPWRVYIEQPVEVRAL